MKTTIELPDALLRDAKAAAMSRRTTFAALVTRALERELRSARPPGAGAIVTDEDGMPCLPARGVRVTSSLVSRLMDEEGV